MEKCTNKRIGELIGLYEFGALEEPELSAFLDHLIECEYCYNEVYAMEPFATAFQSHRSAVQRGEIDQDLAAVRAAFDQGVAPPFWRRTPVLAAAALLVAIGAALAALYLAEQRPDLDLAETSGAVASAPTVSAGTPSPWHDLEIPKAAYTPPSHKRSYRQPTTVFEQAMAAYQEDHFIEAAEQLETLSQLDLKKTADAPFYLGVSRLLAGQSQGAVVPLQQAVQLSLGARRESSHYYLALAYLKTNQPSRALAELDAVIEMNGEHRAAAERLKQQVVEVLKTKQPQSHSGTEHE